MFCFTLNRNHSNYLLAQARIDASGLSSSIAQLDFLNTFLLLQPAYENNLISYLRHAHEQTLISVVEEGRRDIKQGFHFLLKRKGKMDWEKCKKKIFEELGGRVRVQARVSVDPSRSISANVAQKVSCFFNP